MCTKNVLENVSELDVAVAQKVEQLMEATGDKEVGGWTTS